MPTQNRKGAAAKHAPKSVFLSDDNRIAFSMRECADAIGVSERSIWSLVNSGKLPSFRLGRSVRISLDAIEAFMEHGGAS